jgi:hypothetical protein
MAFVKYLGNAYNRDNVLRNTAKFVNARPRLKRPHRAETNDKVAGRQPTVPYRADGNSTAWRRHE